jgi:MerR family mercuric resistance operon transcriptional regulator
MTTVTADEAAPRLSIGALSKRTGCNIETIRYYERLTLLPKPARTAGGHRAYSVDHLRRLRFVRRARELGFTLDEVRALLRLSSRTEGSCAQVRELAAAHLASVRAKLADLCAMERALVETVELCSTSNEPSCPLIEALSGDELVRSRL